MMTTKRLKPGIYRTIAMRAAGMGIKEIARVRGRSPKSIRESIQRHAPQLVTPGAKLAPNPGGSASEATKKDYRRSPKQQ